jgi:hypothetical protein
VEAGVFGEIVNRGEVGKPDGLVLRNSAGGDAIPGTTDIGIIVEIKATHKLAMSMTGLNVSNTYNEAYDIIYKRRGGRTTSWSNVCHPIGQILGYMVENGRRYGALSTGTRTYFLHISGNGASAQVHTSNAWLIGQAIFCGPGRMSIPWADNRNRHSLLENSNGIKPRATLRNFQQVRKRKAGTTGRAERTVESLLAVYTRLPLWLRRQLQTLKLSDLLGTVRMELSF